MFKWLSRKKTGLASYQKLIRSTYKPYIEIKTRTNNSLPPWQSKFAGIPYMPNGFSWPQTSQNKDLHLLAQINFKEIPELLPFPQKGLLQFWLAEDDLYGLNFDDQTKQDSFRVIYFPEIQKTDLQTNFDDKNVWSDISPFASDTPSYELTFKKKEMPVGIFDFQAQTLLSDLLDDLPEDLEEEYMKTYNDNGHRIGGYAYFTQSDPRDYQTNHDNKKVLLLQIDSDGNNDIMWGDMGVANFFINEEKLKNLDFSDILYNWDCC